MSIKLGSLLVSVLPILTDVQSINKRAFLLLLKVCKSCVIDLPNTIVLMSVWNLPVSIGSQFLMS